MARVKHDFLSRNVKGPLIALFMAVACFATLGVLYYLRKGFSISSAFFLFVLFCIALGFLSVLFWACCIERVQTLRFQASPKLFVTVLLVAVALAMVGEFLTLVGAPLSTPFDFSDWSKKRFLVFFAFCMAALTTYLFHPSSTTRSQCLPSTDAHGVVGKICAKIMASIPHASLGVCSYLVASLIGAVFTSQLIGPVAARIVYLILMLFGGLTVLVCLFRRMGLRPEIAFLALCLFSGSFLAFFLPPLTAVSWDDQIHYDRVLGLSYLGHSEFSEADRLLVGLPWADNSLDFEKVREGVSSVEDAELNALSSDGYEEAIGFYTPVRGVSLADFSSVGYFPSAIALWIARLFQLPILMSVIAGRFGNLIVYSLVVAYAIKITPHKKGVFATVGLLPTSVFLASNFSYDPVVISFLMLAIALFLREASAPDSPLRPHAFLSIIAAMFVGLAPKAIYFPIIGVLFLMPKSKFSNNKKYRCYLGTVVLFGLVMVCSFLLPMLFSADVQAGDARGGSDVNAAGQIAYILSHPVEYAQVLGNFMLGYLSPINSDMYTQFYAYMGFLPEIIPWLSTVPFACLIAVTMIDVSSEQVRIFSGWGKLWIAMLFLTTVALVCTALYVSFTPVGLDVINGVQARYLIPILTFAALAVPSVNNASHALVQDGVPFDVSRVSSAVRLGCVFAFLMSLFCSFNLVVFW